VSPSVPVPQALPCAVFVVAAMSLAGIAHALWLRSSVSKRLATPVDLNLRFRGRRLFGPNKMWRGFAIMPPAAAIAFWGAGMLRSEVPTWLSQGMWNIAPGEYAALGLTCGLAFMLAELPNSFIKRQLDIAPGMAPRNHVLAAVFFLLDRLDSVLGVLIALSALLPVSAAIWAWVLLLGPSIHWLFSLWLYRLRVKARPL
jgi:hypothetical protein